VSLIGILIAVIAPLIGTFLVHRQLALIGDALAHTASAGVAVGLFLNATAAPEPRRISPPSSSRSWPHSRSS
jgi:ABC-type Mn2+/Zn2+ transport system permease subunit